jgi:hypothetical protein
LVAHDDVANLKVVENFHTVVKLDSEAGEVGKTYPAKHRQIFRHWDKPVAKQPYHRQADSHNELHRHGHPHGSSNAKVNNRQAYLNSHNGLHQHDHPHDSSRARVYSQEKLKFYKETDLEGQKSSKAVIPHKPCHDSELLERPRKTRPDIPKRFLFGRDDSELLERSSDDIE